MKLLFLLVVGLIFSISLHSQVNAGSSQSICAGQTTTLQGSGPAGWDYTWTSMPNDPTISNPNILTPTVQPSETTIYTLTGTTTSATNLVSNGDFELGNTGFTSDYDYCDAPDCLYTSPANGEYGINSDPSFLHTTFPSCGDHTTGSGNMMIANGDEYNNLIFYETTVSNILPNTDYEFSTWLTSMVYSLPMFGAKMQFEINGTFLGTLDAPSTLCQWDQFFEVWNSGSATSATIKIINLTAISSGMGNDFAIDDVALYQVLEEEDNCTVTVTDVPSSTFTLPSQICMNDTAIIIYTGNAPPSPTADYNWDFGVDAIIISGSGEGPYNIQWGSSGIKTVSLWIDADCDSDITFMDIQVNQNPDISITADATSIPYGTNTNLYGHMVGNPGPLQFTWYPALMLTNPTSQNPTTVILEDDIYYSFEVVDQATNCSSIDSVFIQITGGAFGILSATGTPDTICPGQSTNLHISVLGGSGLYNASWTSNPPGYANTGMIVDASPTTSTDYFVEVSDGFSTLYDTIEIVVLNETQINSQPQNSDLLVGATAQFTVSTDFALDYQWQESTDNGISWVSLTNINIYSGVNSPTLSINPINIGMDGNLYKCIILGNCNNVSSTEAKLGVFNSPDFIGNLNNMDVCVGDTFLIACNVSNFLQIIDFSLSVEFDNSTLTFIDISDVAPEIAINTTVTISDYTITVEWDSIQAITIPDGILFNFTFTAFAGGSSSLAWNNQLSNVINQPGLQPTLILTDGNIVSNPLAVAPTNVYVDNDTINIVDEINIILTAEGGFGDELIWSSNSCNGDATGTGTPLEIMRPATTTTYYANWDNQCGDSECSEVQVVILYDYNVGIPNAFTPNGDGLNDDFMVVSNTTLDDFRMQIFSRWGELIFESNDQLIGWDGTYKGDKLPTNSYFWKISYYFSNDGANYYDVAKTGTVMLVR